jgi:hypothetical protein
MFLQALLSKPFYKNDDRETTPGRLTYRHNKYYPKPAGPVLCRRSVSPYLKQHHALHHRNWPITVYLRTHSSAVAILRRQANNKLQRMWKISARNLSQHLIGRTLRYTCIGRYVPFCVHISEQWVRFHARLKVSARGGPTLWNFVFVLVPKHSLLAYFHYFEKKLK